MFFRYRYGVMGNVRIHRKTGRVERLYVTQIHTRRDGSALITKKEWKVVDYRTTYPSEVVLLPCPKALQRALLLTAF